MELLLLAVRASAIVLVALLGAHALRRRSAALRADLWRATFVALALLPLASALLPGLGWLPAAAPAPAGRAAPIELWSAPSLDLASLAGAAAGAVSTPPAAASSGVAPPAATAAAHADGRWPWRTPAALVTLTWIWLAGALLQALRVGLGLRRAARIAAGAERSGRAGPADVARSAVAATPFVWDARPFARPVVVLPARDSGDRDWDRAVLAHELHHVEHRDGLVLALAALVAAFYWPTPLAHVALRRLRLETERAADDAALRDGARPSRYARGLVSLASPDLRAALLPVPTMAARAPLTQRIEALLDPRVDRRAATRRARAAAALALLVASTPIALVTTAEAQEPPRPDARGAPAASVQMLERALDALAALQDEETGAWRGDVGYKLNHDWRVTGAGVPHVGTTGLAVEALARAGVKPDGDPRDRALARGVEFLLSVQDGDGYFTASGSRMRSHAYALRGLAAIHRAAPSERTARALLDGVRFSLSAQSAETGGWRFVPRARDSDVIETAHQLEALRLAAQELRASDQDAFAAIEPSLDEATRAAFAYAASAQILEPGSPQLGAFRFQPSPHARVTLNTTGAGLIVTEGLTRNADGSFDHRLWPDCLARLAELRAARTADLAEAPGHFLVWDGELLADLALDHLRTASPEPVAAAGEWRAHSKRWLAEHQREDGRWACSTGPGDAAFTAIGCLLLLP